MSKEWIGDKPKVCQMCGGKIVDIFIDGKVGRFGSWAIMCNSCHISSGTGLGTGKGQKFEKQPNGSWLKIEG